MITTRSKVNRDCQSSRIRDSILTINRRGRCYYTSRDGVRMLVVEPRVNQRIRINGTIELVVLETSDGEVRLGVDYVADLDAHMPTKYAASCG
jgi:hypothetical protein